MKAGFLQKIRIFAQSIYATLKITIMVMYQQATHTYDRKYGDGMLDWWARKLLKAVGLSWEIHDPYKTKIEPGKRYIIMSNHCSHYDIPLIFMALPGSIRMLTKKELFKVPLWGRGLKDGEFIAIDRHNIDQAKKDLEEARKKMEDGVVLWIAPEGTRSPTGKIREFKKGGFILAIQTGALIIPVGISGSQKILPPKTWDFNLKQHVKIEIGKPIDASRYTLEEKDYLLKEVKLAISELVSN